MFCDRTLDNKINRIHRTALCIASQNTTADFNTLLPESNSVSIHKRDLQLLMIEVYKNVQNINPSFMKEIFVQKDITHNFRNHFPMRIPKARTSSYGIESLSFLGYKLWNNIPDDFKRIKLLHHLKGKLKDGMIAATAGYAKKSLTLLIFISFYIYILALFLFFYVNISLLYCIILHMDFYK